MSGELVGVRGEAGIVRNLVAFDLEAVEAIKGETRASLKRAYRKAQAYCPVDKGNMKKLMRHELSNDDLFWEIFWDETDFLEEALRFYPPYVEYGTSRNRAQPSITPAHFEEAPVYSKNVGKVVSAALERRRAR